MSGFEKFEEKLLSKEKFYSFLTVKKNGDKDYGHAPNVWNAFEMKKTKEHQHFNLKCGVLLLADVFEKIRSNSLKIKDYTQVII